MNSKAFLVIMVYCVHAIKYDHGDFSAMMEPNYANTTDVESFGAILNEMVSQSMAESGCSLKSGGYHCVGACINGNKPISGLAAAQTKCGQVNGCTRIMKYSNGKYYLRKANDRYDSNKALKFVDYPCTETGWVKGYNVKGAYKLLGGGNFANKRDDCEKLCVAGGYKTCSYQCNGCYGSPESKLGVNPNKCVYGGMELTGKGKKHGDIYDLLIQMKASIQQELKSSTATANKRCTSDTTKKDMTREKDFGCGTKYLDLIGCNTASECEKGTEKQQNLAVAAYKAIALLRAKNAVLENDLKTAEKCKKTNDPTDHVAKKKKNEEDHLARMKKFQLAIEKLGQIDGYLDEETGKIQFKIPAKNGKAVFLSEEEKNVIGNFKVGKAMLLLLDQAMTGAKEKKLVKTLKKLLASCIKSLEASKLREKAAHKNWMKEIDAEIKAKKDAVARCVKTAGDKAEKIAANNILIKAEEKKKTNALATSKTERESCLNAHKDFVASMKDFNLEINAIDQMIKVLKTANLEANTAVIRDETEKTKHGVKESLEVSQCGSPPKGQVFLAAKTAKSWCAAAPCKKAECFEDVGKCGSPPKGQVFLAAKVSSSTCAAATCKKAECFEDVGKCGSPPTGQVFKSGKGSTSTCAAATCKKAECFQNAAKCGSPPRGQVFKRGKGSNSICAGATCRNGECFQKKTYPVCGNVYEHYGKGGWKVAVRNGENDTFFSHANDKASAVRVTAGCKLLLWEHAHYKGAVRTYDNRNGNAARDWNLSGFNDIMSSLKCSCI